MYDKFHEPLPSISTFYFFSIFDNKFNLKKGRLKDFKEKITTLFPVIFDTKHISTQSKQV